MWGSVLVRDTAPLVLILAMKPLERKQLDSVRAAVTMSGKVLTMRWAWA